MYRIRFHGRGGQGMKTASRILGSALFSAGFEVQDAPRYGAERRGAPIFAYVRAGRTPIDERGVIQRPDLVVVADDGLIPIPAAGVLAGIDAHCLVLIRSTEPAQRWRERLNTPARVVVLPITEPLLDRAALPQVGAICAGAAARLLGVIPPEALAAGIEAELGGLGARVLERNLAEAMAAYEAMATEAGAVVEGGDLAATDYDRPAWVDLEFEPARISAPAIHAALTSELVETGLWRSLRPEIDYDHCKGCWWVCGSLCPDGAIRVENGRPRIDYDHCKGCLVCLAVCPPHAISAHPEAVSP